MSYYTRKHLNEGFNIFHRGITFTDAHEEVLNTSLDGNPTISNIFVAILNDYVKVYSIFKRCRLIDKNYDSNPAVYALKGERGWHFTSEDNKEMFWRRFTLLLRRFLRDHKNEWDTTIIVPSSSKINANIGKEIEKIAKEVGITHISNGGLYTLPAEKVLDSAYEENSYFRKFWKDKFDAAIDDLERYVDTMNRENEGKFKYHIIDDQKLRRSVLNTLAVDNPTQYSPYINGKNIIIVDDTIAHGQTIQNAIYAMRDIYIPKTISVLTMFSRLYDEKGEEIKDM